MSDEPIKFHETAAQLLVDADDVRPFPGNPNFGDEDVIADSIRANGVYRPLYVQRSSGYVIAGNHLYAAMLSLGAKRVPVAWVDCDDATAARIVAVDNRSAELAERDTALLVQLLEGLDGDLLGTGYEDSDLLRMLSELDADEAKQGEGQQSAEPEPFSRYSLDDVTDEAVAYYRERGFPYRDVPLHDQMMQLNRLAALTSESLLNTDLCYHVADTYHPHRFHVPIAGKRERTAVHAFEDDKRLRRAIALVLNEGGRLTDTSLLAALGMVLGSQTAANFRPGFALLMYRRFAEEGATVLDTSTGFGGRMLGFAASRCAKYVGIDPNVPTYEGNMRMAKRLGFDDRVQLLCQPAEDVDAEPLAETCDFAFTSPPYFSKEQYSDDDTQSWKRYGTGEAWREGFLVPMMRLQHTALRDGAHALVNIADVTVGGETYPLVEWTTEAAERVGFTVERVERFPLARVPGQGEQMPRFEPVIVASKR